MSNAVELMRSAEVVSLTPMDMLNRAVESGQSIEVLTKLMDLQERWEKNQARKAFDEAMARAKSEIPVIRKNREVDFTSQKGRTHYRHEDLAEVARTVNPILAKHGLSYRFRTASPPNEPVTVTCIVSHRDGYSEENTLSAGRDNSGSKNDIQSIGSTLTYLQRMTIKAALGLAASEDDDGKASAGNAETISDEQIEQLQSLIAETATDIPKFVAYMKVERIEHITTDQFPRAVAMLNKKKAQAS